MGQDAPKKSGKRKLRGKYMNKLQPSINTYSIPNDEVCVYDTTRNNIDKPNVFYLQNGFTFMKHINPRKDHRHILPSSVGSYPDPFYEWRKNGKRHNINGPALIEGNARWVRYSIEGRSYSKSDWENEVQRYLAQKDSVFLSIIL